MKKELSAINKQQTAQIRELTKDKNFYEATCNALMKDINKAENPSESTTEPKPFVQIKSSTSETLKSSSRSRSGTKSARCDSKYKISTKLFEDNKKLWDKLSKLTRANASLRLQVKRMEKAETKFQSKKQQQVSDLHELENLLVATTRTNSQIFDQQALFKLNQFRTQ